MKANEKKKKRPWLNFGRTSPGLPVPQRCIQHTRNPKNDQVANAHAHLSDGCTQPCEFRHWVSHVRQLKKCWVCNREVLENSWKTCRPKQPDLLVGQWAIFVSSRNAGTSSGPGWISHFTGSFVGHSPSEMLCSPASFPTLVFYSWSQSVTHTHHKGKDYMDYMHILILRTCCSRNEAHLSHHTVRPSPLRLEAEEALSLRRNSHMESSYGSHRSDRILASPGPKCTAMHSWQLVALIMCQIVGLLPRDPEMSTNPHQRRETLGLRNFSRKKTFMNPKGSIDLLPKKVAPPWKHCSNTTRTSCTKNYLSTHSHASPVH